MKAVKILIRVLTRLLLPSLRQSKKKTKTENI